MDFSFSIEDTVQALISYDAYQLNYPSLSPLIMQKCISKGMAERVARSGLNLNHLQLAYSREGRKEEGIKALFTETASGNKIRVTNRSDIIKKVDSYFEP